MTTKKNWTLICGCKVNYTPGARIDVVHCRMHQAAPQLLEALKYVTSYFDADGLKVGCLPAEAVWPSHLMERITAARGAVAAAGG